MVVATAWGDRRLLDHLGRLAGMVGLGESSMPALPGKVVALVKPAPWERDGVPKGPAEMGASLIWQLADEDWAQQRAMSLHPVGFESAFDEGPQAAHYQLAKAWDSWMRASLFIRAETEPAAVLSHILDPRPTTQGAFDAEIQLDRALWVGHADLGAFWKTNNLAELAPLSEGLPPWWHIRRLRRAAGDGGTDGPRFRGEVAQFARHWLTFKGIALAQDCLTGDPEEVSDWGGALGKGDLALALHLPFLGLDLQLSSRGLHEALMGQHPQRLASIEPGPRLDAVLLRRAIASALSAHGVLRGPCERCAYPAWLVPYRGPKARGPVPASHRLCATCEVLDRREKNAEHAKKSYEARKR